MTVTDDRPSASTTTRRVERLSSAAAKRVLEPDDAVPGSLGDGQVIPDHLLSVAGLHLDLTAEQKVTLAREELAAMLDAGLRFEAILEAGFASLIVNADDLTDPRITFILHEMGEETRHQRLFQRVIASAAPTARKPGPKRFFKWVNRRVIDLVGAHPALFHVLVLGGEEIPDLFQKIASEHPDTDPFLREVNRYHRAEEARHLSFAKAVLPEELAKASRVDRFLVRHLAPLMIQEMFGEMVHAGVYETIGLPAFKTWRAVGRTPERIQLRHEATRPVLRAWLAARSSRTTHVPKGWQRLCGVDARGHDLPDVATPYT